METYDVIVNQPVVIDNGSGVIKAGFAGDQIPKCHFPNYIGRPKHTRVMAGALEGDLFVGPKAQEHRGLLSIKYPMEHGIVKVSFKHGFGCTVLKGHGFEVRAEVTFQAAI